MPASAVLPVELCDLVYAPGGGRALDGLTLTLTGRRRTVILGPNGAGKSVTLRLIMGLIVPDAGTVRFAGAAPATAVRRRIGLVFQRPVLLRRSVAGNLDHALRAYGVARRARPHRIAALLELGGLVGRGGAPARRLSGGEQQRLAILRTMAAEPELLLLDEPAAHLDPAAALALERLIETVEQQGTRIVLVTHDLGQARRLAEEVVFLHRGRVVEQTRADAFFDRPRSTEARAYLAGRIVL